MKTITFSRKAVLLLLLVGLSTCASMDPRTPDINLKESRPEKKVTNYTQALGNLGRMTEIYGTPTFKMQCTAVGDNTGSSASTGAEIPRDITEMMKSALNSIGGKVVYIPYDPAFMSNSMATGYSAFDYKMIPDVVLTGGITEFDRGLETRSMNTDANMATEIGGIPEGWRLPNSAMEMRYSQGQKSGLARITLDFNLLDFQSMTGIPKMNTTNTMEVRKALSEQEMGICLFGQSFGGKGSVKKVQGRHAAIRLLVELSMIQIVGKHLRVPYWRLLGEEAKPDPFVIEEMALYYRCLTPAEIIANVQEWLYLYGYEVDTTGRMDVKTRRALASTMKRDDYPSGTVDFKTFYHVYVNIPLTQDAKIRRQTMYAD